MENKKIKTKKTRLSEIESKIDKILDLVSNGPKIQNPAVAATKAEPGKDQQISLAVSGMHCVSCAKIIEKKLLKVPGVKEVNVNFTAEKARIIFDSSKATTGDLIGAIASAGYKASLPDVADPEGEKKRKEKEIKNYRNNFLISCSATF